MNKSIFIAEVKNYIPEIVGWIIEDLEEMNCGWAWTKDGNIKYWFK